MSWLSMVKCLSDWCAVWLTVCLPIVLHDDLWLTVSLINVMYGSLWLTVCLIGVIYGSLWLTVCQTYYCIMIYRHLSVRLVCCMMV